MTRVGTARTRICRLLVLAWVGTWLAGGASIAAREPGADRFKGHPLSAALATLQQSGLKIVYSSDLVRRDMIVTEEPRGRWPQEILDQLLAPHGLRSKRGPAGTLLIVKAPLPAKVAQVTRATAAIAPPPAAASATGDRRPFYREAITVWGSDASGGRSRPDMRERVSGRELQALPDIGRGVLLPVARLAGITTNETSGGVNVRGGANREAKIILDGLELYEPYHLKDRGGPVGLIDSRALSGVQLIGGAFPAEHGGHLSAVVEMETVAPSQDFRGDVTVGLDQARVAAGGGRGPTRWLISARRGDSSRLLHTLGADPSYHPAYWDLIARADRRLNAETALSFHVLGGDDEVEGKGPDDVIETMREPGTFRALHVNRYAWLGFDRAWTPRLFSQTVLSVGLLRNDRYGSAPGVTEVRDARSTATLGLKQDWLWQASRHLIKWGLDFKRLGADYDYTSIVSALDPLRVPSPGPVGPMALAVSPRGDEIGAYVADRFRASRNLQIELGLRRDADTYARDRHGSLSPRANVVYALGERTTLRAGWGYFSQPQKIYELQVEDGVRVFQPRERAEHRVVSFARQLGRGVDGQVSAYQKLVGRVSPRYENLFDPFGFFPEASADRVRVAPGAARAEGLELVLRRAAGTRIGWWTTYTLARTEDAIDGRWVARSWDQRHSLNAGLDWTPGERWNVTITGVVHSGRPTTPLAADVAPSTGGSTAIVLATGSLNSGRLPTHASLDMGVSRSLRVRGLDLRATLSAAAASTRDSSCCIGDFVLATAADGTVRVERRAQGRPPPLVMFGLSWAF